MENRNGEIHVTTDEARGASTGGNRRWILGIGLLLAIVLVAIGVIIPYFTGKDNRMPSQNAQNNMAASSEASQGQDAGVVPDKAAQNRQATSTSPDEGAVPAVPNSGQGQ